jgi:hypothetical protein
MGALGKAEQEAWLARHERDFQADADAPLGVEDLLQLLGAEGQQDSPARQHAIACFLSAGDGWREAVKELRGAFAEEVAGLKERKAD